MLGTATAHCPARDGQPFGNQYFLILSPSVLNITLVPRCSRICLVVRLIMPWRLPDWANSTLPVPVILKRFLAPDLVLILGIWLSCSGKRDRPVSSAMRKSERDACGSFERA